ncbi:MAG: response regulator [Leptospirales bacterium]|jgi:two-component system repressor protein LuxO
MDNDRQLAKIERRILVVDDDEEILAETTLFLRRKGYIAISAESGAEALDYVRESPPPVVLLDLQMPGMSGEDVLTSIKTIDSACEVILLSGSNDNRIAVRLLENGAFLYLDKPVDLYLLYYSIERAFTHYNLKQQVALLSGRVPDTFSKRAITN